jgi:hypothetical protein
MITGKLRLKIASHRENNPLSVSLLRLGHLVGNENEWWRHEPNEKTLCAAAWLLWPKQPTVFIYHFMMIQNETYRRAIIETLSCQS